MNPITHRGGEVTDVDDLLVILRDCKIRSHEVLKGNLLVYTAWARKSGFAIARLSNGRWLFWTSKTAERPAYFEVKNTAD